jgi:hypothetical protein
LNTNFHSVNWVGFYDSRKILSFPFLFLFYWKLIPVFGFWHLNLFVLQCRFDFPNMKYGKYWFHTGLFIPKKQVKSDFFPSVTRQCRPGVGRNLYLRYFSRLKGYRFEISATLHLLGWIDAPHTQNFEFWNLLRKLRKAKKLKSVLKFL